MVTGAGAARASKFPVHLGRCGDEAGVAFVHCDGVSRSGVRHTTDVMFSARHKQGAHRLCVWRDWLNRHVCEATIETRVGNHFPRSRRVLHSLGHGITKCSGMNATSAMHMIAAKPQK
jgi:hypothetical protein